MSTVNEKMTKIADAIREKTGATNLLNLDAMASQIDTLNAKEMIYVGDIVMDYTANTMDVSAYSNITINDIFLVAKGFTVKNVKDATLTESPIVLGTYNATKSLNNGILTVIRDSITGDTGVEILCSVYIYTKPR